MSDPHLTQFRDDISDRNKIIDAVMMSLFFLAACWALFLMDTYLGYHLKSYGLRPRSLEGLWGLITMHFLHGGWQHIVQNSMAFLVLNSFLFYFYRSISLRVFITLFITSGIMLWIIGRPSNHIGASMLIYGEFAFLFTSGILRRHPRLRMVALFVAFYYGSLIWYIFPVDQNISWEGHLSGLFMGALFAILWRKKGPPNWVYRYETEPEPDDREPYWMPGYRPQSEAGDADRSTEKPI